MKAKWFAALLVIGLVIFIGHLNAEEHPHGMGESEEHPHGMKEHDENTHSDTKKSNSDKARCAFEGMMMNKSAMVALKHGDETLYFCTESQKAAFQKSPKKYIKKLAIGEHHINMNTLTMKEYRDMMEDMGMAKMMKKSDPNDTHWISAYIDVEGHSVELAGMTVKVTTPKGKTKLEELKYDKMMKTFTGNLSLLESGKYKISLLLESSEITMP